MLIRRALRALLSGKTKGHFSQYGEDIVIHKLFPRSRKTGTYVDIGAFHPFYFSNTAYLWLNGWSGINVDANPNSIRLFERSRPRDCNIFGAVVDAQTARTRQTVPIFTSADRINAKGTCDPKTADERGQIASIDVPALGVASILQRLDGRPIDFLNIDIEGLDAVVLAEIDFSVHRPSVICVEDYADDLASVLQSATTTRLQSVGYALHARVGPSSIFRLPTID